MNQPPVSDAQPSSTSLSSVEKKLMRSRKSATAKSRLFSGKSEEIKYPPPRSNTSWDHDPNRNYRTVTLYGRDAERFVKQKWADENYLDHSGRVLSGGRRSFAEQLLRCGITLRGTTEEVVDEHGGPAFFRDYKTAARINLKQLPAKQKRNYQLERDYDVRSQHAILPEYDSLLDKNIKPDFWDKGIRKKQLLHAGLIDVKGFMKDDNVKRPVSATSVLFKHKYGNSVLKYPLHFPFKGQDVAKWAQSRFKDSNPEATHQGIDRQWGFVADPAAMEKMKKSPNPSYYPSNTLLPMTPVFIGNTKETYPNTESIASILQGGTTSTSPDHPERKFLLPRTTPYGPMEGRRSAMGSRGSMGSTIRSQSVVGSRSSKSIG